jgi:hypothetical protein
MSVGTFKDIHVEKNDAPVGEKEAQLISLY